MSAPTYKLAALCFQKTDAFPLLQQFEELYIYGVLSQLARFTELQYRDFATLNEKISLDPQLSYDQGLHKLQQICNSSRTHYAFTGVLGASDRNLNEVKITFRLYEARGNRYIVDEVMTLQADTLSPVGGSELRFSPSELNRLIQLTVHQFAQAIYGEQCQVGNVPFSKSVVAMQLILKAHRAAKAEEKIALYEAALKEDPLLETALYHLARTYKNEQQYEKSVLYYRDTLKISQGPTRHKATYATDAGIACALMGRPEYALQWWTRAIEYDATYINPYFNIANTFEDQDNFTEAEKYFARAQKLAPDDLRTFFNLARLYSKMGQWEKALTQYRHQMESEDADDPWCHSDVATCYLNLGDLDNAKVHLEKTVALDPEGEAGEYAHLILSSLG